jgi:hypothetical protein
MSDSDASVVTKLDLLCLFDLKAVDHQSTCCHLNDRRINTGRGSLYVFFFGEFLLYIRERQVFNKLSINKLALILYGALTFFLVFVW